MARLWPEEAGRRDPEELTGGSLRTQRFSRRRVAKMLEAVLDAPGFVLKPRTRCRRKPEGESDDPSEVF